MPNYDTTSSDPLQKARGTCLEVDHHVRHTVEIFERCESRVTSKSYTAETCTQEIIDLMHAIDHCVGDKAFKRLA